MILELQETSVLTHQQTQLIERIFSELSIEIDGLDPYSIADNQRLQEIENDIKKLNMLLRKSVQNTQKSYLRSIAL